MSLSDDKHPDIIDAFNTTSRYLDNIININNVYFDNTVSLIYPSELQLNTANTSDTGSRICRLAFFISNDIVSTKIYDKRDDFDFETVNFLFLDGDVPRSTSYGVYTSQLNCFARASSHFADFFCSSIQFYLLLIPYFCFISFLYLHLYVLGEDEMIR